MMSEFVRENKNGTASAEQFFALAGERAQKTPLGQKYGYKDLNWFFRQWVVQSYFPSYRLEYHIEDAPGGGAILIGTVFQDGVPDSEHCSCRFLRRIWLSAHHPLNAKSLQSNTVKGSITALPD
jgi:hypothetical protein